MLRDRPSNDGPRGPSAQQALAAQGFAKFWDVEDTTIVTRLVQPEVRVGIYILAFQTGEWYVGKTTNLAQRYASHRRTHPDIARLFFKRLEQFEHDVEERRLITLLETAWGWPLRNVAMASLPKGPASIHDLIDDTRLRAWSEDSATSLPHGQRRDFEYQRRKQRRGYESFRKKRLSDAAERVLRAYLEAMIPAPWTTEMTFWSVTCFTNQNGILVRINLFWQEVLALSNEGGALHSSFFVARSPLKCVLEVPLSLCSTS